MPPVVSAYKVPEVDLLLVGGGRAYRRGPPRFEPCGPACTGGSASLATGKRIGTWGDDAPACYIAAVADNCPTYYGDVIRVMCPEGVIRASFPTQDFQSHLTYEKTDYSYADKTQFEGQVMRANSLARVNMASRMGTPLADRYLS